MTKSGYGNRITSQLIAADGAVDYGIIVAETLAFWKNVVLYDRGVGVVSKCGDNLLFCEDCAASVTV
jgi:hypothetical protein